MITKNAVNKNAIFLILHARYHTMTCNGDFSFGNKLAGKGEKTLKKNLNEKLPKEQS